MKLNMNRHSSFILLIGLLAAAAVTAVLAGLSVLDSVRETKCISSCSAVTTAVSMYAPDRKEYCPGENKNAKAERSMKIHIFGCLSGTEPMPGKHHTALALEKDGALYWFDAGEGCGSTAHLMGLDVRKIRGIFISHPHIDHTAGLPHLFFVIFKRIARDPESPEVALKIFIPEPKIVDAALFGLSARRSLPSKMKLDIVRIDRGGVLFDAGGVRVECVANRHIRQEPGKPPRSFSFLITAEGKRIIFSGDVKNWRDYEVFLKDGCDLLMMESGHHSPPKVT
ncbi:MAG: MBL fold metallo-hydrolase, partial [Lentisphaeria bacterium]|nr:MBL fold metallo-hydrolase [Lentisphaeria bacterium]